MGEREREREDDGKNTVSHFPREDLSRAACTAPRRSLPFLITNQTFFWETVGVISHLIDVLLSVACFCLYLCIFN